MSKKIWKYRIPDKSALELILPSGSRIVEANIQYGKFTIWVEMDYYYDDYDLEKRYFQVFPTGATIPDSSVYIKTVFDNGHVWHLYSVTCITKDTPLVTAEFFVDECNNDHY